MKIIILFFYISFNVSASPSKLAPLSNETNHDVVKNDLLKIKNLSPNEYISKIDKYRESIERFVGYKKRVCNGEFSSLVIKDGETLAGKKKRLSREERSLCFRELKGMQRNFIDNVFFARSKYLEYLHETQIKDLRQAKVDLIKSLDRNFRRKHLKQSSKINRP
jgi:hypothetical protein